MMHVFLCPIGSDQTFKREVANSIGNPAMTHRGFVIAVDAQ